MAIPPLALAAVPAGIAAVNLVQNVRENQPFRQLLSQLGTSHETADTTAADSPENQLANVQTLIQQRLADAGINTSLSFELSADASGQLHVVGSHPHKQAIEQALQNDSQLTAAFHQLAASYQLETTAQQHTAFAEQYLAGSSALPFAAATTKSNSPFAVVVNGDKIKIAAAKP